MINKLIYSNKFKIINKNISNLKTSRKANNQKIKIFLILNQNMTSKNIDKI